MVGHIGPPNGLPITRAERSEGTAAGRVSDRSGGEFIGVLSRLIAHGRHELLLHHRGQVVEDFNAGAGDVRHY